MCGIKGDEIGVDNCNNLYVSRETMREKKSKMLKTSKRVTDFRVFVGQKC